MKHNPVLRMVVVAIALTFAVAVPVQSGPPTQAEGRLQYVPFFVSSTSAGCNTTVVTFELATWSGTIDGASEDDGSVKVHCSGLWTFHALSKFENATVIDESGRARTGPLIIALNGSRPDGFSDWFGYWVILSGEGEVAKLRGQGTWWGPGAPDFEELGNIYYAGNVHFEPR